MIFHCRLMVHITDKRAQKVLYISAHYRNGVSKWPTLGGAKQFILSTAVSSFTKARFQKSRGRTHFVLLREVAHFEWGGNSTVFQCPPPNWKVGCSIRSHWVNCRSAPWARAFTSTTPARSTFQASACRQLPSPKTQKKKNSRELKY